MRFSPEFLDEIKARLPVSEVVGKRIQLQKAGRELKGLSPFTSEKTPSFHVNDAKMAWFDFSSGQNGNIFDFVMKTEGLSFPETVERLANEAGVPLPVRSPEYQAREKVRASLQDVMEMAAQFFEAQLQDQRGARARGYLADRGLTANLQQQFRIGYAPNDRKALCEYLAAKDVSVELMCEAGLLNHGEDIPVAYDKFRDRVMFPICNPSGHVIAFGGRALDPDVPAKYLNSPETPLFHKSSILYNHHKARKAAYDSGTVIAVEGYVDVIAMTASGYPQVVAACGTALTADQCQLMWRMAEEPILCFDGDRAGRKAAWRAIDTALPLIAPGRSLRFAFLPDGQDPDDLARSGGHEAIKSVIDAAKPLIDVLVQRELEAGPIDTPERRAGLDQRLRRIVQTIGDETLRRFYREDISGRLAALAPSNHATHGSRRDFGGTNNYWRSGGSGSSYIRNTRKPGGVNSTRFSPGQRGRRIAVSPGLTRTAAFNPSPSILSMRETQILLTLVNHHQLIDSYAEELAEIDLSNKDSERLREGLLQLAGVEIDHDGGISSELDQRGYGSALQRHIAVSAVASLWCVRDSAAIEDAETALKQCLALHRRERALNKELKRAEFALGQEDSELNLARLREIQAELAVLESQEAAIDTFGLMSGRQPRNM